MVDLRPCHNHDHDHDHYQDHNHHHHDHDHYRQMFLRDPYYTKISRDQRISAIQFAGNVGGLVIIFDHFLQIQAEPFFEEKDTYSWTCGLVALVWIFWTYWSIGELCSCRVHSSELLRVCLTGLFLLKPSAFLDDVKLPQLLAVPFFLSAFGYTRIHTAKLTNK